MKKKAMALKKLVLSKDLVTQLNDKQKEAVQGGDFTRPPQCILSFGITCFTVRLNERFCRMC